MIIFPFVVDQHTLFLHSCIQVESLLERASKNRAVAATLCNERSSRSHSVFMLKITGSNQKTGQKCEGMARNLL